MRQFSRGEGPQFICLILQQIVVLASHGVRHSTTSRQSRLAQLFPFWITSTGMWLNFS
jgi:hypothetical protein